MTDRPNFGAPRARISLLAGLILLIFVLAAPARAATPRDARAFVDSIGVTTHVYWSGVNGNYTMVKQRLKELGVRHIRDQIDPDRRQWVYDRVNDLAANGIKSTLVTCTYPIASGVLDGRVSDAKNKIRSSLDALEGSNEPDLKGGGWVTATKSCQYWLYRLAKGSSYGTPLTQPILAPAMGGATTANTSLGDISDRVDAGNLHGYPGGQPPHLCNYGRTLATCIADARKNAGPTRPVHATETGYHDALKDPTTHPPTSQKAIAIYLPRLTMEHQRAGMARSFFHELVDRYPDPEGDEREKNFGLFENDWSYKPSATALKNMIGLIDSPSASARSPLGYTLTNTADPDGSGSRGAVRDMLFQKADGSWWLALWQDSKVWNQLTRTDVAETPASVGVTLDRTVSSVQTYRPTYGAGVRSNLTGVRSFTVQVSGDVLRIKLIA